MITVVLMSIKNLFANILRFLLVVLSISFLPIGHAQNINPDEPWNWPEEYVLSQVNQVRAGRDLTPESWPGGARVAVLLSYDVCLLYTSPSPRD